MNLKECLEIIQNKKWRSIYIFGAGSYGKNLLDRLKEHNIVPNGFVVSNLAENEKEIRGIKVYSQNDIQDSKDDVIIIIGVRELGEHKIYKELQALGWKHILDFPVDMMEQDDWFRNKKNVPLIEITSVMGCSVNCRYCPQKALLQAYYKNNPQRQRIMSLEEYKKCLEKLPANTIIEHAGFVEPFLNPEAIEMMEYTQEAGFKQTLFTTLVGLTAEGFERLKKIPFERVVLHVADENGYAQIPVTEDYINLLETVVTYQKENGSPFVDNANSQCKPHGKVLEAIGGRINVSYHNIYDRAGNLETEDEVRTTPYLTGALYCESAVNVDHNVLLPDGTLVLCCNDFGLKHELGNLLESTYEEIMSGEEITRIRQQMLCECSNFLLCRKCVNAKQISSKHEE